MKLPGILMALLACLALGGAKQALARDECDSVLVPTEETLRTSDKMNRAYARVNWEEIYDTFQNSKGSDGGGKVKLFDWLRVEYAESKSKEDFGNRVQKKLNDEKFELSEAQSRAYMRRGLEDFAVTAWLACIKNRRVALAIFAQNITAEGFSAKIQFVRPEQGGRNNYNIKVEIVGGTADGKNTKIIQTVGGREEGFYVRRTGKSKYVTLIANGGDVSDEALVDFVAAKPPQPKLTTYQEQYCDENEKCPAGAQIIGCQVGFEHPKETYEGGAWLFLPGAPGYEMSILRAQEAFFGPWENTQCGVKGTGYHAVVGTCGNANQGTAFQRCVRVKARVPK